MKINRRMSVESGVRMMILLQDVKGIKEPKPIQSWPPDDTA